MSAVASQKKSTNGRFAIPLPVVLAFQAIRHLGRVHPPLASQAAQLLWSRPRQYRRPERERALLREGRSLRIPFGLGELPGWQWGDHGPVVLGLHGWEGRGAQFSEFVPGLVAAGFRVVLFDAPAHGEASGRRSNIILFADALQAAARHVGPVHTLLAHSMGGAASILSLDGGLHVQRVVLIAPADASKAARRFTDFAGLGEPVARQMEADMEALVSKPLAEVAPAVIARRLKQPCLVVHDRQDRQVPSYDGERIAAAWEGAQLMLTEGLGHSRVLRDPEVVQRVLSFVTA